MEPICWLGIAGIVGITAALCGMFSKSCKGSGSSCGCESKKDIEQPTPKSSSTGTGIDDKKEKAINDLIK